MYWVGQNVHSHFPIRSYRKSSILFSLLNNSMYYLFLQISGSSTLNLSVNSYTSPHANNQQHLIMLITSSWKTFFIFRHHFFLVFLLHLLLLSAFRLNRQFSSSTLVPIKMPYPFASVTSYNYMLWCLPLL